MSYRLHKDLAFNARQAYSEHRLAFAPEEGYVVLSFDFAENTFVPVLNPQGLSEQRKAQLQYFEPYIDQGHRYYILTDY